MNNDDDKLNGQQALAPVSVLGGTIQESHPMTGLTMAEINEANAGLTAENDELHKKVAAYDDGDCAPYWLCRAMAEAIVDCKLDCERAATGGELCHNTDDCITEWCVPCAAKAWLEEQQRQEALLPPNDQKLSHAD
jgi:hypothetical protein